MPDETATPPDPLADAEELIAHARAVLVSVPLDGNLPELTRTLADLLEIALAARDETRDSSAHAVVRIRRLVAAERDVVGLRAEVDVLTRRLEEQTYDRDAAEQALAELRDNERGQMYVPGDDEPPADERPDYPLVLLSLGGSFAGSLFYRPRGYSDYPWRTALPGSTVYDWLGLEDYMPLVDVSGGGAWRLLAWVRSAHEQEDEQRRAVWKIEDAIRTAARSYPGLTEGATPPLRIPERAPAGSAEQRRGVVAAALYALERLPYYAAKAKEPAQ